MQALAAKDLVQRFGIALTGGIATGKSAVAAMLAAAGHVVIDADRLARDVTATGTPGLAAVVGEFGAGILTPDGSLDRAALGRIVFADPAKRRRLETITHPLIRAALGERLTRLGLTALPRPFFYEAALIYETGTEKDFRAVWATVCDPKTQLARLVQRSGLGQDAAARVIAQQMSAEAKALKADVVIRTDGTLADVEARVQAVLKTLATA